MNQTVKKRDAVSLIEITIFKFSARKCCQTIATIGASRAKTFKNNHQGTDSLFGWVFDVRLLELVIKFPIVLFLKVANSFHSICFELLKLSLTCNSIMF